MRILHVTPLMGAGGAERQLLELMRFLKPQVTQHLLVVYPTSTHEFFFEPDVRALDIPLTMLNKRPGKIGRIGAAWRYWQLLRRFQPDVVHAYQWHAMDIVRAFHKIVPLPCPKIVVTPQNKVVEENRLAEEHRFCNDADAIVFVSDDSRVQYELHIPNCSTRYVTIPNGINPDQFFRQERKVVRRQLRLPEDNTLLLFAGRINPQKNVLLLLQAVQYLIESNQWRADTQLICIGRRDDPIYAAEIDALLSSALDLHRYVKLLPPTPEIANFYHAGDALVLPSKFEGLPGVVLEAGACARPTLISDAANQDSLVTDGETGWVVPTGDRNALADGIARVVALSSTQRDRVGEAMRQFVLANYSVETIGEKHLSLYRQIIENQ